MNTAHSVIMVLMIVVLTGTNDFMRSQELAELTRAFIAAHGEFGLERIDAGEVDLGRLIEAVSSLPFLTEKRMVIVQDLSANKQINENVEQLLDAVSDTTELILVERKFDKRLTLYKTLKKRTDFREFPELDERGVGNWLVSETRGRGGSIKPNDANYLVQRVGADQMGLSGELDKLLSWDANITKDSIDALTEPLPRSSIFDLLDAAFTGNKKHAMELYEDQRNQQVEPQAIMGMIAWQIHAMAVVKFNEKDGVDAIAREAKLNPFVVRKTMSLIQSLSKEQVRTLVNDALRLDVRLKSEPVDADDAVRHFLLTV